MHGNPEEHTAQAFFFLLALDVGMGRAPNYPHRLLR
jgi:hypothetical protein